MVPLFYFKMEDKIMEIKLNVYRADMETVKKKCAANTIKLPFGFIRKMMKLFDIDNLEDSTQILNVVTQSFDEAKELLERIFPDITEEEWDYVDTKELVDAIFLIMKSALSEMLSIPTNPKN